jgi:DNA-binding MarR family transcriptional regulator
MNRYYEFQYKIDKNNILDMRLEDEIAQKKFKSDYEKAAVNMIYSYNWLMDYQVKRLKPHGITLQQFNILRILRGQHPNPATIKLIKERMLDKMSDASRIVEKLRIKGLADRKVCPNDRRNVDVCITQKGLELLAKLDANEKELEEKMGNLCCEEIAQLNQLLDKLRD